MANFDERSGIVACTTRWGEWWQTMEEVFVGVNVPQGTRGKDIRCTLKPSHISLTLHGDTVLEGDLPATILPDDSLWTLEDRKYVRLCLVKSDRTAANCWRSLLVGQYQADPMVLDQMQQKLTLQRFQFENPGMDFSGAKVTGTYQEGGPSLPSQ